MIILFLKMMKSEKRSSGLMVQLQSSRRNIYMCHLLNKFSTNYNKRFSWKFSATSQGRGVVDRIGGNVKSIVQSQSMGKRKDKIIMQVAKLFYQVASNAMNATEVFLIDKTQVEAYRDTNPFNGFQTVPGIMSMHIISGGDDELLEKCVFFFKRISQTSLSIISISIQQKRLKCPII